MLNHDWSLSKQMHQLLTRLAKHDQRTYCIDQTAGTSHTAQQIGPLPIQNRNSVPAGCRNPAVAQRRSDRWSCFGPQPVSHMRFSANGPNVRHSFSAIGILILPYATMATPSPPPNPHHTTIQQKFQCSISHLCHAMLSNGKCPLHSVEPQNSTS